MSAGHILPRRSTLTVPITFTDDDFQGVGFNQDDPMVIHVIIANSEVRKVLVDQGSSADILFVDAFYKLGLLKEQVSPFHNTLVGFVGEQVRGERAC